MSCIKLKKKSSIKWWILTICLSGFGIKNTKNSAINCDMRSTPTRILQEWSLPTWHCDKRHSGDTWIMKIGDATFWYSAYRHFDTGIFEKPMRVRARGRLYQDGLNVGAHWDYWACLQIDWVLLREYSPADSADYAEECSGAALYRRERQIGMVVAVIAVLLFWVSFEIICVIWEIHRGFMCANIDWVLLRVILPQIVQRKHCWSKLLETMLHLISLTLLSLAR